MNSVSSIKHSLRKAVNAKCKDCIYDNLAPGTWRQQVTLCTVNMCPLWEVRPRAATPALPGTTLGQNRPVSRQSDGMLVIPISGVSHGKV